MVSFVIHVPLTLFYHPHAAMQHAPFLFPDCPPPQRASLWMWRTASLYCAVATATVEECLRDIHRGHVSVALPRLNDLKAVSSTVQGIDYARALCFLFDKEKSNLLAARQSLLEELRLHPEHHKARTLLHEVNDTARVLLAPPAVVRKQYPLFSLLFDALFDSTMLTWPRLLNLYQATDRLARLDTQRGTSGDSGHVVECGTAGGGSAVLMAVVLAEAEAASDARASPLRRVFALDSFTGMPPPTAKDRLVSTSLSAVSPFQFKPPQSPDEATASWGTGTCRSPAAHVRQLARNFGVDDRLEVIEGLFADSIPTHLLSRSDIQQDGVALLHIDADWYASTRAALEPLIPLMRRRAVDKDVANIHPTPHRMVQVDDYHYWQGCRDAVDECVAGWGDAPPRICDVDDNAVWFAVQRDGVNDTPPMYTHNP